MPTRPNYVQKGAQIPVKMHDAIDKRLNGTPWNVAICMALAEKYGVAYTPPVRGRPMGKPAKPKKRK